MSENSGQNLNENLRKMVENFKKMCKIIFPKYIIFGHKIKTFVKNLGKMM